MIEILNCLLQPISKNRQICIMLIIHHVHQIFYERKMSRGNRNIYIKNFKIIFYNNLEFNKDKDHIMQWNSEY